jgi:hypothetical protein
MTYEFEQQADIVVASLPEMTDEQARRISALLMTGVDKTHDTAKASAA